MNVILTNQRRTLLKPAITQTIPQPFCIACLGDLFNFLFLNYFIETNSNLMQDQFMELAKSLLESSEINIAFYTFAFHLSLKNIIFCGNGGSFVCSKIRICLKCNKYIGVFFCVYLSPSKQINRLEKTNCHS